jgi:hypothetical protein
MPSDFIAADLLVNAIYSASNSPPLTLDACSSSSSSLFLFAFSFQPAHHHTRVSKSMPGEITKATDNHRNACNGSKHLSGCCCIALPIAFHKFFLLVPTEADTGAPVNGRSGRGWWKVDVGGGGGGGCHKRLWNERNGLCERVLVSDARKISPVYITIKVSSLNSTTCSLQSTVESYFTLSVFQLHSNSAAHTEARNGVPAVALAEGG